MRVMRTSSTAHATAASHSISSPAVESATYVMGRGLVDDRPAFVQAAAPDGGPQHGQPDPWKRLFASVAAMVDAVREKEQVQLAPWVTRRRAAAKAKAAVGGRAAVGRNVRRAAVERVDIIMMFFCLCQIADVHTTKCIVGCGARGRGGGDERADDGAGRPDGHDQRMECGECGGCEGRMEWGEAPAAARATSGQAAARRVPCSADFVAEAYEVEGVPTMREG